MPFRKITIVGVGLLGGSIGLAVRKRGLATETAGFVRREASVVECEKAGAADYVTTDLLAAVSDADLVILCTPLAQMRSLVYRMLPALKRGAVVTDVGSVKGSVVDDLEKVISSKGAHFVGSHPMAGAEKAGVLAARAGLFEGAVCIVTPTARTDERALIEVEHFWNALDARVVRMSPKNHDALVSRSSHLPHIVAAALANLVLDPKHSDQQTLVCANGFRDTTRIASGSPEMWRDIALANRRNLDRAVGKFIIELQRFQRALNKQDEKVIAKFLEQAKRRRDAWCSGCTSTSPE